MRDRPHPIGAPSAPDLSRTVIEGEIGFAVRLIDRCGNGLGPGEAGAQLLAAHAHLLLALCALEREARHG